MCFGSIGLAVSLSFILQAPPTGRQIMEKVDAVEDGKSEFSVQVMMSCAFRVAGSKKKCKSRPRKKVIESVRMDTGASAKDTVSVSFILEPTSEKGMAFKQYDHDEAQTTSEQWMYMPALKKLKRIVSAQSSGPRTGTLFGSEIAYEDIEKRSLDDYDYKLLGEEKVYGEDAYVIESRPRDSIKGKTSYGLSKQWIGKSSFRPFKSELYNFRGQLVKTFQFKKHEKVDGIWVTRQIVVVNHTNQRMSMMAMKKLAVNPNIDEKVFDVRALNDTAFRENLLRPIRSVAK
ncbi:MAG: outer membrane lipoprotein-sorting protein [Myxococcota bacterium]|nr:outer membrane lipoprotein-sorting protein [Myxococcota bacterium]